ncbi:DUF7352 domain-containing protein [Glutamicibacter arilaitensis]|uniref:DUF7352 domain-containing protein n=1 Tax=Glutamicibacter arilaitensis TaxID=256701 RepID=UPI003F938A7F
MNRRIFRYELNVDDQVRGLPAGKVVHFADYRMKNITGECNRVEVWVEAELVGNSLSFDFAGVQNVQIFSTGQPIPDGADHLASCLAGQFVWHLYRLPETPAGDS